jgi:hypothetical protein
MSGRPSSPSIVGEWRVVAMVLSDILIMYARTVPAKHHDIPSMQADAEPDKTLQ